MAQTEKKRKKKEKKKLSFEVRDSCSFLCRYVLFFEQRYL